MLIDTKTDMWKLKISSIVLIVINILKSKAILLAPSFTPIVISANYTQNYNATINSTIEYVFLYPTKNVKYIILLLKKKKLYHIIDLISFLEHIIKNCKNTSAK